VYIVQLQSLSGSRVSTAHVILSRDVKLFYKYTQLLKANI